MTQPDLDYDNDLDDSEDEGTGLVGDLRKQLKAAKKAQRAAEETAAGNSAAARRVAFLDAQVPDTPQTKFFREHYSGELDPETIRAQAIANGFMEAEDHTDEVAGLDLQSSTVSGGELPTRPGSMEAYEAELDEALRNAPRGQESKVVQQVYEKYQRTLG